jgi:putative nucleotidyltransferase with HDIG domain
MKAKPFWDAFTHAIVGGLIFLSPAWSAQKGIIWGNHVIPICLIFSLGTVLALLNHELYEYEDDLKASTKTTVVALGKRKSYWIVGCVSLLCVSLIINAYLAGIFPMILILSLAMTAEIRDPYTAGHQRQVANLASAIAEKMGIPGEQIDSIHLAGTIHDIGKMQVPTDILSKCGKLTELEFDMIKTHSQAGYDILKTIEFQWPIAEFVLQHHGKMDGSGYPSGLNDENILIEARILSVADAMVRHRPYRPALGIKKTQEEIFNKRGILYDSNVVDACFSIISDKNVWI